MARPSAHRSVYHGIADPTRRAVLDLLRSRDFSAGEILATFRERGVAVSQSTLSQHLGVLRRCGLVAASWQGRSHVYSLTPGALRAVAAWLRPFETMWERGLGALGEHLDREHGDAGDGPGMIGKGAGSARGGEEGRGS
ncbi:MAG: winged helix-turn-helix transcriptional regulator [Planctomycetes bacterium]|nr:winged helix-turn-helix transcriptional regulator [Planctomycetota bacterium]